MEGIVYIQTDESGRPYSANGAAAARGFAYLGYEVRYFKPGELAALPLTAETIVVGGMGTVRAALEQIGTPPPLQVSAPAILRPYLGRESWRTTPAELRTANRFPVFVKPYEDAKAFTGRVVANVDALDTLLQARDGFPVIEEDFPLLAQEPVTFLSEWRVFVVRGRALGVSHYEGDPLLFPAAGVIRTVLGAYRETAPAGYSADFGVTSEGRTLLVEVNDGYSLGNGGLVANLYADLLRSRWNEITGA
jgi:hypothetical protein